MKSTIKVLVETCILFVINIAVIIIFSMVSASGEGWVLPQKMTPANFIDWSEPVLDCELWV